MYKTFNIQKLIPHETQSLDYKKTVFLTSDPLHYDPENILKKLMRNRIDHLKYEPTLFKKTKVMLKDF